ncbi:MAG: DUF2235 domain-containing protein [Bacteroidota bacterium]
MEKPTEAQFMEKPTEAQFMEKPTKQRLAIFLDGTWNTEDDSTNVLHAYHSTKEGLIEENGEWILQKRYYDRGVGTTVSDNVRGGGYGMGLEKNVREAYNWLVDNYNDNSEDLDIDRNYCFECGALDDEKVERIKIQNEIRLRASEKADEIYIFGFSRGAYTARSLVGLIATCGLIKRGSPITVSQLWNAYAFISKNRGKSSAWWKKELEKDENKYLFGRISGYKYRNLRCELYNDAERLLNVWSRRVNITYLGIYDTVGAMGIHALGIPGLKSKLDAGHNTNPTSIIVKCRHALAIDEQRPSFRLTPILNWVSNSKKGKDEFGNETEIDIEEYDDNIEQMWFMGVHSNIGGGYPNNNLSMKPILWIMEGACKSQQTSLQNITLHDSSNEIPAEKPDQSDIRDSFSEMMGGAYPHVVRSKRHYRPIGRPQDVRAGYSLRAINEDIHPSVFELAAKPKSATYAPPNLQAFLENNPTYGVNKDAKVQQTIEEIKSKPSQVTWPGEIINYTGKKIGFKQWAKPRIFLLLWALFASLGTIRMAQFFWIETVKTGMFTFAIIALLFILIDWGEHKVTLSKIRHPYAIRLEVYWNILYWLRLFAIPASILGLLSFVSTCIYGHYDFDFSWIGVACYFKLILQKLLLPQFHWALGSVVGITLLLYFLDKGKLPKINMPKIKINPDFLVADNGKCESDDDAEENEESNKTEKNSTQKSSLAVDFFVSVMLILVLLIMVNFCDTSLTSNQIKALPQSVLMVLLLAFGSNYILKWVGKPMGKEEANMGSIFQLQACYNKTQVTNLFNSWVNRFYRRWIAPQDRQVLKDQIELIEDQNKTLNENEDEYIEEHETKKALAWYHVRKVLRKAIWRDIIGFVPLYNLIMLAILYLGQTLFWNGPLAEHRLWLYLVAFIFVCDQVENIIELKHIEKHPLGGSNSIFIGLGAFFTFFKIVGFFASLLLCLFTIGALIIVNLQYAGGNLWLFSAIVSYILIFIAIKKIVYD